MDSPSLQGLLQWPFLFSPLGKLYCAPHHLEQISRYLQFLNFSFKTQFSLSPFLTSAAMCSVLLGMFGKRTISVPRSEVAHTAESSAAQRTQLRDYARACRQVHLTHVVAFTPCVPHLSQYQKSTAVRNHCLSLWYLQA